jgi:hypothetical protein
MKRSGPLIVLMEPDDLHANDRLDLASGSIFFIFFYPRFCSWSE